MKISGNLIYVLLLSFFIFFSCKEDQETLDPTTASLVQSLDQEVHTLSENPIVWKDEELQFLDEIGDQSIVALGESTHGTSEFFKAKHRIFRYLVEHHGYKVFAFEADFGESLFLNEKIQLGWESGMGAEMRDKMHFWTWKTKEVQNLLEWMGKYNQDKAPEDKIHYVGVDCQFNTFHPDMVREYLEAANVPFLAEAAPLLDEAKTAANDGFKTFTAEDFEMYLQKLNALQDSIETYKTELTASSSEKEYDLHVRILEVVKQVSEVRYYGGKEDYTVNYRDQYMAENTAWWQDYFQGEKMVVWAHNGHIADNLNYGGSGAMGYHLAKQFAADYTTIGFLFSQGAFNAVGQEGEQYTGLREQMITDVPLENSLNAVFSHATPSVFYVSVADLEKHDEWQKAFNDGIKHLSIGAVFNNKPADYYYAIRKTDYDHLIYIDRTTASTLLY